jgi:hypothetical protein
MSWSSRIVMSVLVFGQFALSGCTEQQTVRPAAFHGKWQEVCSHPSMSDAAYREAHMCHVAARLAAADRLSARRAERGVAFVGD